MMLEPGPPDIQHDSVHHDASVCRTSRQAQILANDSASSGFTGEGQHVTVTGEQWGAHVAATGAQVPASPTRQLQTNNMRHPGTPLGGERPRRGPRSTPRRIWRDSPQTNMDTAWHDRAPRSDEVLGEVPPFLVGSQDSQGNNVGHPSTSAPAPDSQESIFSFGIAPGSQDTILAARADAALSLDTTSDIAASAVALGVPPFDSVVHSSQDSLLAAETERALSLDATGRRDLGPAVSCNLAGRPAAPPEISLGTSAGEPSPNDVGIAPAAVPTANGETSNANADAGMHAVEVANEEASGSSHRPRRRVRRRRTQADGSDQPPPMEESEDEDAARQDELPAVPRVFIHSGTFKCPWCDWSTRHSSGLMTHCTTRHPLGLLTDDTACYMASLGRNVCRECGFLRLRQGSQCGRCSSARPGRMARAGDMVQPVNLGAINSSDSDMADASAVQAPAPDMQTRPADGTIVQVVEGAIAGPPAAQARTQRATNRRRGGQARRREGFAAVTRQQRGSIPVLPSDFLDQLRAITGSPTVHIPACLRERFCAAASDCLEGTLAGDGPWAALAEAHAKLLLYAIPWNVPAVAELEQRAALWEERNFEGLLLRIQRQAESRNKRVQQMVASTNNRSAPKRARRMAKEGARSKAVSGLQGGIKRLTPQQQREWGAKLLPQAEHSTPAAAVVQPAPVDQVTGGTETHPLKGIYFPPMTAPGPSLTRPEHIQEMLSVRRRCVANRLLRAIGRAVEMGLGGVLPDAARWILGSGVTFLEKPGKDEPRPIRAGEWLRKVIGKTLINRHRKTIRKVMVSLRQFGVALPGGAEALFHARETVEAMARSGTLPPLAVVDVDLVNCYGSLEWDAIIEAYEEFLPEAVPWERWCTNQPCEATLPSSERVTLNRGAGQGEPDGPVKAAATIGQAAKRSRSDMRPEVASGTVDVWFIDDGQLFTHPRLVDPVLRALDTRLEQAGATRGRKSTHGTVKSLVRVFVPAGQEAAVGGWDTDYVKDSCNILSLTDPVKVLGGIVGTQAQMNEAFIQTCENVDNLHQAIDQVQDAATEVVLKKACADVSKVVYTLRLNGDRLAQAGNLPRYSGLLRDSLARSLGGDVGDHGWQQATCGTSEGGLGLRTAEEVALPAFIASRVSAAPAVRMIFAQIEAAGLAPVGVLGGAYEERTNRAIEAFKSVFGMDSPEFDAIELLVAEGAQQAADTWLEMTTGETPPGPRNETTNLLGEDEGEDDGGGRQPRAQHLQKKLSALVDGAKATNLAHSLEDADLVEDGLRLEDLRDKHQENSWMWALNPIAEPVLPECDWLRAMRLRLGCTQISSEILCASCGERVLDKTAYHALCCARGESTRGHNRVRDVLHAGFVASDAGARVEVMGLIPSHPDLRPADVLTTAARPNVTTAVDVGISCPHSSGAGVDCTESMRAEKLRHYGQYLPELEAQGIEYAPATFSAYGRRNPSVTQMLTQAAREAARRRGIGSHNALLRRWYRTATCEIWRRASRMIVACVPREPRQTAFMLDGEVEDGSALRDDEDDVPYADAEWDLESNLSG